jgi:hypothetical protein
MPFFTVVFSLVKAVHRFDICLLITGHVTVEMTTAVTDTCSLWDQYVLSAKLARR